jgi:predicted nucleotidyltransferase
MIPAEKFAAIQAELSVLSQEEEVTILWACESGSRAWGFESQDSDYDVRFIYLRKTEAYLRASEFRDVIEKPISADLDISGWDLPKALGLFRKTNPPLLEWLQSPIIYLCDENFATELRQLLPSYFSPIATMYHYMSMADRNRRSYLEAEMVKAKRYFYMLRPVLACMWIHEGHGVPPIEFQKLLDRLLPGGELREAIDQLTIRKKAGEELDLEPRIPILADFITEQIARFTEATKETQFTKASEPLDRLFLRTLIRVNGNQIEQREEADGQASLREWDNSAEVNG